MSMHHHSVDRDQPQGSFLTSRAGLVIGSALLFTEHRAHVLGVLIWLPLLACPLMHIFMHGGHGGYGGHGGRAEQDQPRRDRSRP